MFILDFQSFTTLLAESFSGTLPGREAQVKMSSAHRIPAFLWTHVSVRTIRSSVLILLYPLNGSIGTAFILRPDYGGAHGGQISLPGGKREACDNSPVETALREAREEVGVIPSNITIAGILTELYIPYSDFLVTPVVGYSTERPVFIREPSEVERIIEVPLMELFNPVNVREERFKIKFGISIKTPCFVLDGNRIWGATAMIISEFLELIRPKVTPDGKGIKDD